MTRTGISLSLALGITFALLFLMQLLIATGRQPLSEPVSGRVVDFVRVKRDETPKIKKPPPVRPLPPEQQPPKNPPRPIEPGPIDGINGIGIPPADANPGEEIGSGAGFASDGEYLPIVKVAPVYPRRALERGIEGDVELEFTVTRAGTVRDPIVIEANPPNVFEQAAIRAALKFKYKPRVVDGEPIDVRGVRNVIRFRIDDA